MNTNQIINTKYGEVSVIIENGKKKYDYENSKFNSMMSFIAFLNDSELTKQIFGY